MDLEIPGIQKTLIFLLLILLSIPMVHSAPLTIVFTSPSGHPLPYNVNVAGTFNEWQMNEKSIMSWQDDSKAYALTIPHSNEVRLFNLYKDADWQNPMATKYGKPFTCGFITESKGKKEFKPDFNGWAQDSTHNAPDTIVGNLVKIADFPMPQLKRTGDIYIHLPKGYQQHPNKRYPVAYMLDGQNLFSEALSYSDEWQVDEIVTAARMELIVVGITNGPNRWQEYSPWDTVDFMGNAIVSSGEQTIEFIRKTLKPYMDTHYKTLKDPHNTALLGSSLGGLMAVYGAIEYGETFGKTAAFSPAFSFPSTEAQNSLKPEQSQLIKAAKSARLNSSTHIYFDMGEVEYGDFSLVDALHQSFLTAGYSPQQLKLVKDKLGRHCEQDWSRRLPGALQWLFGPAE